MTDISRRLKALELRMNAERPAGVLPIGATFQIIAIDGGVPPGIPLWGRAGGHVWYRNRDPLEDLVEFAQRIAPLAMALGEPVLVLGGLASTDAEHEIELEMFDLWAATDSGVPEVEGPRRHALTGGAIVRHRGL
jgi:hypothetical protein